MKSVAFVAALLVAQSMSANADPADPVDAKEAIVGMDGPSTSPDQLYGSDALQRAQAGLKSLVQKAHRHRQKKASARPEEAKALGMDILPEGAVLHSVRQEPSGTITIEIQGDFDGEPQGSLKEELLIESVAGALLGMDVNAPFNLMVSDGAGGFRPAGERPDAIQVALPNGTIDTSSSTKAPNAQVRANPVTSARFPYGAALAGKRIALSPGHGWLNESGSWNYQRALNKPEGSSLRGIHEDLFTNEFVSFWLVPLLENMGAEVVLARNLDHAEDARVIIDNSSGASGGYTETGSGWGEGANAGGWQSNYRTNGSGNDATASFMHTFSTSGWRRFSTWFLQGTNRAKDARFTIVSAGGEREVGVDQTLPGKHFLDLGQYWCAAGVPCGAKLKNGSTSGYIIADALMMGGGTYEYQSGKKKPLWHIAAYNYLGDFLGLGRSNFVNDVQARPLFAKSVGNVDAFLSIHSNASGSTTPTAHGIATYRYNCSKNSSLVDSQNCDLPHGSKALSNALHNAALGRIRQDWDKNFCNRRENLGNLGELRLLRAESTDTDTSGFPGVLIEVAFHDNVMTPQKCTGTDSPKMTDNQALHDPRYREALAYGIADGFGAYFGTGKAPPPRPTGIRAINGSSPCTMTVSWKPVSGAQGYRLYTVENVRPGYERAFDKGQLTTQTSMTLTGLQPGKVYAFRVAALDKNGEGYPSTSVAARVISAGERVEGLYVNGYDRRDAYVQEQDNDLAYATEHGIALGSVARDFYFDGATKDLVEDGTVKLSNYAVVDYQSGKNSTEHHSVSATMQTLLTSYLGAGGKLFISGEELAYDLDYKNNGRTFIQNTLGTAYVADNAKSFALSGSSGSAFAGLKAIAFDNGTHGTYEVKYPDAIKATSSAGAKAAMTYDGTSYTAAIESTNAIVLGMPLETIYPAKSRAQVTACAIGRLLRGASWTCTPSAIDVPTTGAPEGTCDEGSHDEPDAGADPNPDLPVEDADSGTIPTPADSGVTPDPTDEDDGGIEYAPWVEDDAGQGFGDELEGPITISVSGCSCDATGAASTVSQFPLLLMGLLGLARRKR